MNPLPGLPRSIFVPTQKQREANRLNAQKSTGPRSAAGKDKSRMNALKSGLYAQSLVIRDESSTEFEELKAQFDAQFNPVTPQARVLLDGVIRAAWLLRRFDRVEADVWDAAFTNFRGDPARLSEAFYAKDVTHDRIRRIRDSLDRTLHRNLKALQDPQVNTLPATQPVESEAPPEEIGFVPSDPPQPLPPPPPIPPQPSASPRLRGESEAPESPAPLEEAS